MLASEIPERREILLPDALLSLEDVNQSMDVVADEDAG